MFPRMGLSINNFFVFICISEERLVMTFLAGNKEQNEKQRAIQLLLQTD